MAEDIKEDNKKDTKYEPLEFIKQIQDSVELSKRVMEEKLQKSIIENIEEEYKDTDIPIYEKLSPGDIYIVRIIDEELEVIQNDGEDVKYKRVALSIDEPS